MAYYSSKLWGKKKAWKMEAFIAPENFDPSSQPLNIVSVFGDYNNVNKAYIYSFTSAIATLTLPASAGVSYRWGETISGVDYVYDVASGTAFTAGSTKRYVIVNSTASSLGANISASAGFNGAVWIYCSSKIYSVVAKSNTYLKYIHCEDLNSIKIIGTTYFADCKGLMGILTIPSSITTISQAAFANCTGLISTLTIPSSVTTIEGNPFYGTPFTHLVSNSSYFEVYDEVLYTTTGTITAIYSAQGYSGTLTLKSNVVVIVANCFFENKLRTGTLTIPNTVTTIGASAFYNCIGLTDTFTIPNSVTTIYSSAFYNCNKLSGIGTINGSPAIGQLALYALPLISEWHILSPSAPSVQSVTWANYAKPLHVKIGATGYDVLPWTNTAIFSSIIYDL